MIDPNAALFREVAAFIDAVDQEVEDANERLDEGQMEMLLTGHAATHGIEGEDNWLIETEETQWGER